MENSYCQLIAERHSRNASLDRLGIASRFAQHLQGCSCNSSALSQPPKNLATKVISFLIYFSIRLDKSKLAEVCWEQNEDLLQ